MKQLGLLWALINEEKAMQQKTLTGNPALINSYLDQPPLNPLHLLQQWLDDADRLNFIEPRGLVLSTINGSGVPSSRVVLLKSVDNTGVIFSSSEVSQKGVDIQENPVAAGTLWWRESMQQINFYGTVAKLDSSMSDSIFKERTPQAQAVAVLSIQSTPMVDEIALRSEVKILANQPQFIFRPESWHAYHIGIKKIEFWHGSHDRFHNRVLYQLENGVWSNHKLQP